MAFQTINVGTVPNDRSGDPLRTAFGKINGNFTDAQEQIDALEQSAPLIFAGAVAASITGTTTQTAFATVTIPAGSVGANGWIEVSFVGSNNNSANNKVFRVLCGGVLASSVTVTTTLSVMGDVVIQCRNNVASQVANSAAGAFTGTAAPTALTTNMANSFNVSFTGQLANAADSMTLESYIIRVFYRP